MEKTSLIDSICELPCRRHVNHFDLEPMYVVPTGEGYKTAVYRITLEYLLLVHKVDFSSVRIVWSIFPSNAHNFFYFKSLTDATRFAKKYKDSHPAIYWTNLFKRNPIYSLSNVVKCSTQISFAQ